MLTYLLIVMLFGAGITGWMGYTHTSNAKALKQRMHERNAYYSKLNIAKETDAILKDKSAGNENQLSEDD